MPATPRNPAAVTPNGASSTINFVPHPHRGLVLGEVHARPFRAVKRPARLLHFAFVTDHAEAERDRAALTRFCEERGVAPPSPATKQHVVTLSDATLRWEQHGEFTTYTWDVEIGDIGVFSPTAFTLAHPMTFVPQPGPHLCSVDLQILPKEMVDDPTRYFDATSLCHAKVDAGGATVSTDLKPGADGFIRYLVVTEFDDPARIGGLAQHILELEIYRTLALLGLPEAQRLGPAVRGIESQLVTITSEMTRSEGLETNHRLLDQLTMLAAQLEADAASSLYRFGATTAYNEIMRSRLKALGEEPMPGRVTLEDFLGRRHDPAMRTCQAIVERQANLSRKLARATQLLRSRVEVEIEQQNRDLLAAMNERTRIQLRLQQTVEGLSVVAITYYLVGLISYLSKAAFDLGWLANQYVMTAASVPIALLAVWFVVRRLRTAQLNKPEI